MPVEIDDDTLVARARQADAEAFELLVRRHADRLYAVILRLVPDEQEAQEATQETFLRAWRGIARFKGDAQFFTWLYRIGVNEANRRLTRGGASSADRSLEELAHEPRDLRPGPAGQSEAHDLRGALEAAVRALPLGYRTPLVLRDIEGLSTDQAAAIMDLHPAAFKSRLHRARLTVRRAVQAYL
ncbi:MAG: RNA polymerase sigma factor [Thermoleophilaceae bacterium]